MNMGFMFRGFGMYSGIILVLIIPAVVYIGLKLVRRSTVFCDRGFTEGESETPKAGVQSFQSKLMKLALNNEGILTVTDVVMATGLSIKQAEKALNNMVDGYRVKMEVKDSGVIVYEFTELINKERKDKNQ